MRKQYLNIFLLDTALLLISLTFMIWMRPGSFVAAMERYWLSFLVFLGIWFTLSVISGKYLEPHKKTLVQLYTRVLVSDLSAVMIVLLGILILPTTFGIRVMILGTAAITFVLELMGSTHEYFNYKYREATGKKGISFKPVLYPDVIDPNKDQKPNVKPDENKEVIEYKIKAFQPLKNPNKTACSLIEKSLKNSNVFLYDLIRENVPTNGIRGSKTQILNTKTLFNIQTIDENSSQMFVNLHRVNDIRRINEFFIQVNKNMVPGGYLVGCALTIEERGKQFFRKYKTIFAWGIYSVDFIITRIIPKIPYIKILYFALTSGEGRAISRAEVKGRLIYCGFEPLAASYHEGYMYFIMRKVKEPSVDQNPSYGPFIKMKRVGENGDIVNLYKFRTMHPYSEYVQDYLYKQSDLDKSGKFKDDFRIASWGKVLRRLWIDELPQLLNLYRGQLKLVGVRALSPHYFSLYPKELQELRTKTKPGLVPPFYKDLPKNFEEICESERKYLEAYLKKPWRTDWKYFWAAMGNIVLRKARSG